MGTIGYYNTYSFIYLAFQVANSGGYVDSIHTLCTSCLLMRESIMLTCSIISHFCFVGLLAPQKL